MLHPGSFFKAKTMLNVDGNDINNVKASKLKQFADNKPQSVTQVATDYTGAWRELIVSLTPLKEVILKSIPCQTLNRPGIVLPLTVSLAQDYEIDCTSVSDGLCHTSTSLCTPYCHIGL